MDYKKACFPIVFLILLYIKLTDSIACVKCATTTDADCVNPTYNLETLVVTNCSAEMNYCVVYYGVFKSGDAVVFRDCNDIAVEHKCSYKVISGQSVNICYQTCSQDRCNGWPVNSSRQLPTFNIHPLLLLNVIHFIFIKGR